MKIISIFALIFTLKACFAAIGLDGIQALTPSTFTCLANNGYSFFIGRIGRSNGQVDSVGVQNIKNANAAGYKNVDGYIFPCSSGCVTAANQVQNAINALKSSGAQIGTLWLDIETYNWPSDTASNRQFITDMINTAQNNGYRVGIYTNANNWNLITGSWTRASSLPLWWAKFDDQQSISNFTPFGGWSKPTMKQYAQDVNGPCGVSIDQNFRP